MVHYGSVFSLGWLVSSLFFNLFWLNIFRGLILVLTDALIILNGFRVPLLSRLHPELFRRLSWQLLVIEIRSVFIYFRVSFLDWPLFLSH